MAIFRNLRSLSGCCLNRYHGSTAANPTFYDIVVVGGGMTGLGFCALAATSSILKGKRILLIESAPLKPYVMKDIYETRTVALNRASKTLLESVGAWDYIQSKRMQPVNQMKIWEDRCDAYLTFENGPLAYIVENSLVTESLRIAALRDTEMLTLKYGTVAKDIQLPSANQPGGEPIKLTIEHTTETQPKTIETSLLVGADGVESLVRKAAGLQSIGWNHGQSAVVAILCMDEHNKNSTAWQRFISTGPIALLPLSDNFSSLIWSTTDAEADCLMALPEKDFVHRLNDALTRESIPTPAPAVLLTQIGQRYVKALDFMCGIPESTPTSRPIPPHVKSLQQGSVRGRFPIGFRHTNFYHAPGIALIGDAAHRILPLAGQGVNLGFGDVMCLVRKLEDAIAHGSYIGNVAYLQNYTTERQRVVVPMAATMEALNMVYSTAAYCSKFFNSSDAENRYPVLRLGTRVLAGVRALGVDAIQSSGLIKKVLLNFAANGELNARNPGIR